MVYIIEHNAETERIGLSILQILYINVMSSLALVGQHPQPLGTVMVQICGRIL